MTREEMLAHFRQVLEDQLRALLDSAHVAVSGLVAPVDWHPDPVDRATADRDRGFLLHIRSRESRLIRKIRDALERIDDGTYGICQACEEEIDIARLRARPVASYCIDCKRQMEAAEKAAVF